MNLSRRESLAAALALSCLALPASTAMAGTPSNDDVANARNLGTTGSVSVLGTNYQGTVESGEAHGSDFLDRDRSTAWYRWTPPSGTDVTINVCDADFHMVLAVYRKTADPVPPFSNLIELGAIGEGTQPGGCSTENGATGVLNNATAGATYYIQIAGWAGTEGDQGPFTLKLTARACRDAQAALKQAERNLKKAKNQDKPKSKIKQAKRKVRKAKRAVNDAC